MLVSASADRKTFIGFNDQSQQRDKNENVGPVVPVMPFGPPKRFITMFNRFLATGNRCRQGDANF
jgi:hypothetical protein